MAEFREEMEKKGFDCVLHWIDEFFWEDFVKKSCWDLFEFRRKSKTSQEVSTTTTLEPPQPQK